MPKAKKIIPAPTAAEIAAARGQDEQEYLAWARRLIDDAGWNWHCRSRRCHRNGCQDVRRCEPQQRPKLHHVMATLSLAELQMNSLRKEVRDSPQAAEHRQLLKEARKRGWQLPGSSDPQLALPSAASLQRG